MEYFDIKKINTEKVYDLLNIIDCLETDDLKSAEKDIVLVEIFGDYDGVFIIYYNMEYNEYKAYAAFKEYMEDYNIAIKIESVINEYLSKLNDSETFVFTHEGLQLFLNCFVCRLNFERPHYGMSYRLKRSNFTNKVIDLGDLEFRSYNYDKADEMFLLHERTFREQTVRLGFPEGYDEEDIKQIKDRYGIRSDEKRIYTYYLHEKLIGFTVFYDEYCDIIALDPAFQGNGLGKKMFLHSLIKEFENEKINEINLHTFFINAKAQKLYKSLGFVQIGFRCVNEAKPKDKLYFKNVK